MPDSDDIFTSEELRGWLRQELKDLKRSVELRTKDATDFVTAYAEGKLTPDEANERLFQYQRRWGETPIAGISTDDGMTDEQILKRLDETLGLRRGNSGRGFAR